MGNKRLNQEVLQNAFSLSHLRDTDRDFESLYVVFVPYDVLQSKTSETAFGLEAFDDKHTMKSRIT